MDAIKRTESNDNHEKHPNHESRADGATAVAESARPNGQRHGSGDRNGAGKAMPVRQASLAVADAIEGVLHTQETRHAAVNAALAELRQRQDDGDARQRQISDVVAAIAERQQTGETTQQQLQTRQDQIAASVDTILSNQKTSSKCYQDVMSALTAIARRQQATDEQIAQLTEHVDRRSTRLTHTLLIAAAALAGLAIVNVVLALV